MNLELDTMWIWSAGKEPALEDFFAALPHLLAAGDVLVIGSYELDHDQRAWFDMNSSPDDGTAAENILDSFELNRDEYPSGRYWLFQIDEKLPEMFAIQLAGLSRNEVGYTCLDHIMGYRKGVPVIPLFRYRHAFREGRLELSGHYSGDSVTSFGDALGIEFSSDDHSLEKRWPYVTIGTI